MIVVECAAWYFTQDPRFGRVGGRGSLLPMGGTHVGMKLETFIVDCCNCIKEDLIYSP